MTKVHEGDEDIRFLDTEQVLNLVPVSRTTLWRWIDQGHFPRPVKNGGTNLWCNDELRLWKKKLMRKRRDDDI